MPEAPQYGGPQVRTAPIATPRQDPGIATPDAYGASAVQGLGKAAYSVATVHQEEADKKRQDDAFALVNRATSEVTRLTAEAKQQRGKSAEGLTERTRAEFDKVKRDVSKDTTDPDILAVFERQMEMRWRDVDSVVTNHAVGQLDAYKRQEYDSANVQERLFALEVGTIDRIEDSLLRQEANRELAAVSLGDDPSTVALKVQSDRVQTISAAIDQRVESENYTEAKAYLDHFGDRLDKSTRTALETKIREGGLNQRAQETADAIFKSGYATTKADADRMVSVEKNADLRQRIQTKVDQEWARRQNAIKEGIGSTYERGAKLIETGGDVEQFLVSDPDAPALGENERTALRRHANFIAAGKEPEEWGEDYTAARNTASWHPDDFASMDLRLLKGRVRKSEYDDLNQRQQAIRALQTKADGQGSDIAKGFLTIDQQVKATLRSIGVDPSEMPRGDKRVAAEATADRFMMLMDKKVRAAGGASKVTPEQVKQFADDLLIEHVFTEIDGGLFWFDSTKKVRTFELPDADRLAFSVDQIPSADRAKAIAALAAAGVTDPTPDEIIEWHNGTLMKNAKAP